MRRQTNDLQEPLELCDPSAGWNKFPDSEASTRASIGKHVLEAIDYLSAAAVAAVESKQSATLEDGEAFGYNRPPDPLQDTIIIQHWCTDTLQWMTLTPMTRDEALEEVLAMQGKKRKTDEKGI